MKLYATTTSERASKGQGGNDYLDININIDSKEPVYRFRTIFDELLDIYYIHLEINRSNEWIQVYRGEIETTKGEKKKGDSCKYCGITHTKYELCPLDIPR